MTTGCTYLVDKYKHTLNSETCKELVLKLGIHFAVLLITGTVGILASNIEVNIKISIN